jgi:hypothetical protein
MLVLYSNEELIQADKKKIFKGALGLFFIGITSLILYLYSDIDVDPVGYLVPLIHIIVSIPGMILYKTITPENIMINLKIYKVGLIIVFILNIIICAASLFVLFFLIIMLQDCDSKKIDTCYLGTLIFYLLIFFVFMSFAISGGVLVLVHGILKSLNSYKRNLDNLELI